MHKRKGILQSLKKKTNTSEHQQGYEEVSEIIACNLIHFFNYPFDSQSETLGDRKFSNF